MVGWMNSLQEMSLDQGEGNGSGEEPWCEYFAFNPEYESRGVGRSWDGVLACLDESQLFVLPHGSFSWRDVLRHDRTSVSSLLVRICDQSE